MTNQRPATEELIHSRNRARWHQYPTTNMLEVWHNLTPFGGRPIGSAVEALLTKVINWQLSVLPIVVFVVAVAVSIIHNQTVLRVSHSQRHALRV
jgi:hypothetical protein